ncbi:MAG: hypothetical protein GY906_29665 [bacterium]|nr:hypothetical protein [bacterium]
MTRGFSTRASIVAALLLVGCCCPPQPQPGPLVGLRNPGGGGRQLVSLDPVTGTVIPLGTGITTSLPSASGVDAIDGAGGRFFFVASPPGETDSRLYTMDTTTGAVLHSPTLLGTGTAFINGLTYDDVNSVLFGLRNPGGGGRQLVTLDPATGVVNPLGTGITSSLPSASGVNALDATGGRFFFVASPPGETDSRLYTFDTTSGVLLHSPSLAGTSTAFINGMEYDAVNSVLLGLRNPGGGGRALVSLDPVTGAITAIGTGITTSLPSASGVTALDAAGERFFFVASPPGETDSRLYTFSTQTGATLNSPALTGSGTAFINGLGFTELRQPVVVTGSSN